VQGPNDPFNEFYTGSTSQSLTTVDKELLDALGFHTLTPVATTVIEALGSTSLVQLGNNYYLDSISSGTGPELKYGGAAVVAGQFAPYTPVGVEQTASGYEVALQNSGANLFSIWNTDSNGNFLSYTVYSGTSTALQSLETSFHQDLNGDGVIGIPALQASGMQPESVAHSASVMAARNDTFAFRPDLGSGVAANAQDAETIDHDWLSSFTGNHLTAPQIIQPPAIVSLDSPPDPTNHDSTAWMGVHLADLHANGFLIR
jgi:hypothetical protein